MNVSKENFEILVAEAIKTLINVAEREGRLVSVDEMIKEVQTNEVARKMFTKLVSSGMAFA
jgi:hypothetical protein